LHQIIQNIRNGKRAVVGVPDPLAQPGQVLIANAASLISAGTEKMVMELAQKSLLGKARERPDHVRRVIEKIRNEGFFQTLRQVSAKLDEPMPMGYSSAGWVLACGPGVSEFKPGDRVASNGPHAGIVSVPKHLCARVPGKVPFEQAAFTVVGAIALQGVRLAQVTIGSTVLVIGLGLVGQLTVTLLRASGVRVIGFDLDPEKCRLAERMACATASATLKATEVEELTLGLGVDAVVITASTRSNAPLELAAQSVRKKGRIVLVGVVGLQLDRRPFYFKECEFVVSCSYGPGRYDPQYEERGHDYPAPYVRWTEQRNLQAVVDLMAGGQLNLVPLISHRFPIDQALQAYELIEKGTEPYLGIILQYPETDLKPQPVIELRSHLVKDDKIGVGCLGAGNFARMVLLPAIQRNSKLHPQILCSAKGLSAAHAGNKLGFDAITADEEEVFKDSRVKAVFILTRHDQHGQQVVRALKAGKHVFTEKPLCLNAEELAEIESIYRPLVTDTHSAIQHPQSQILNPESKISSPSAPLLMVGFNRRFSPAAVIVREFFNSVRAPLTVSIRFNAGQIPSEHWTQDEEVGGGRIIGEACHGIDLATFLTGSKPVRVYAESVGGPLAPPVTDDQCFITLRHANGAVSSIAYLAGGDRAYPKERVEVLGGGKLAVIDDFREVTTCSGGKSRRLKLGAQDKGHEAEIDAFSKTLSGEAAAPITWQEIKAVSLASILAVQSIREGVPFEVA